MCGLFAIINHHKRLLDKRAFITLGCANDTRGGDACGIMIDGEVERGTKNEDKDFQFWYSKSKLLNKTEKCYVALGHCRKASVGGTAEDKAQPVTIFNDEGKMMFCLIHNGTIHNYKELATKYIPEVDIKDMSDSQVMAQIFYRKGYEVLGEYRGGAAFIIQDYRINKTYIFRGESLASTVTKTPEAERPLYLVQTGKSVIFSSIYSILQGLYWGFDVYDTPSNVLLECDGTTIYTVQEYDRTKCYSCKHVSTSTPKINYSYSSDYDDIWDYGNYSYKGIGSTVDFDCTTGTYFDKATKEELHGIHYISDYGYISQYATGYNTPYYFWQGIMISGENAYNRLRKLQADKIPMSVLVNLAKRLSCNPTLSNKRYYEYSPENKRIAFSDIYAFPLTDIEIVCNKRGKVIAVYHNPKIEKFIPANIPNDTIDKIVRYVKDSI
jgi:hypothetical protein